MGSRCRPVAHAGAGTRRCALEAATLQGPGFGLVVFRALVGAPLRLIILLALQGPSSSRGMVPQRWTSTRYSAPWMRRGPPVGKNVGPRPVSRRRPPAPPCRPGRPPVPRTGRLCSRRISCSTALPESGKGPHGCTPAHLSSQLGGHRDLMVRRASWRRPWFLTLPPRRRGQRSDAPRSDRPAAPRRPRPTCRRHR